MRTPISLGLGGLACMIGLAACSADGPAGAPPQPMANPPQPQARCDAKPAQDLVGQTFDNTSLARVQTATGAQETRVLSPDSMITKEYKVGRVNVVVDAAQRIVSISCG